MCIMMWKMHQMKQHHVNLFNLETNTRQPLAACRRKDDPNQCKADFPRTEWSAIEPAILCAGLVRQMGLRSIGKRCMLGSLHGPMNHGSIHGAHPAKLAVHRCNSDVLLPNRFLRNKETHCCADEECLKQHDDMIIEAAQVGQDAQAGYACGYCTKLQPMAFNDVKECCKGHRTLSTQTATEHINRIGRRHAIRSTSEADGKGTVRGEVENTNLRAYSKSHDVSSAEAIHTSLATFLFGREFENMVQILNGKGMSTRTCILCGGWYMYKR